jgi:hypothetical protein
LYEAHPAKSCGAGAAGSEVGDVDAVRVPDNDLLDLTGSVDEQADATASIARKLGDRSRERGGDEVGARDASAVEAPEGSGLMGLEPGGVAVQGFQGSRSVVGSA